MPLRVSERASRKRAVRYGDAGELDQGPASRFRSAPPPAPPTPSVDRAMGVPAFALPGETVWAMGLHAGVRKRFKARVTKLRKMHPRIVVRYFEDETGNTNRVALPDMITAYVTSSDVQPV